MPQRIAVTGATGTLGKQLLAALEEADHPGENVVAFASERSEGQEVDFGEDTLPVEAADYRGVNIALIAVPLAEARAQIDAAQKHGAWVIDFSGAFRSDINVPLIAPASSPKPTGPGRVISIAGPTGLALAAMLGPLKAAWVDVVGALRRGVSRRRRREAARAPDCRADGRPRGPQGNEPFAHRLAFNVIPQVGAFAAGGHHPFSTEELAVALDVARAMPKAPVLRATALQVPVFHGILLTVSGQLEAPLDVSAALKGAPGVKVIDSPAEAIYPMPMLAAQDSAVHVGRIRTAGNHFWFVASPSTTPRSPHAPACNSPSVWFDNLSAGGSFPAVQARRVASRCHGRAVALRRRPMLTVLGLVPLLTVVGQTSFGTITTTVGGQATDVIQNDATLHQPDCNTMLTATWTTALTGVPCSSLLMWVTSAADCEAAPAGSDVTLQTEPRSDFSSRYAHEDRIVSTFPLSSIVSVQAQLTDGTGQCGRGPVSVDVPDLRCDQRWTPTRSARRSRWSRRRCPQ